MKLSKLMLSAFAAAVAMVACNKVETDVPENTSLKTVKLSFENVIMTRQVTRSMQVILYRSTISRSSSQMLPTHLSTQPMM